MTDDPNNLPSPPVDVAAILAGQNLPVATATPEVEADLNAQRLANASYASYLAWKQDAVLKQSQQLSNDPYRETSVLGNTAVPQIGLAVDRVTGITSEEELAPGTVIQRDAREWRIQTILNGAHVNASGATLVEALMNIGVHRMRTHDTYGNKI